MMISGMPITKYGIEYRTRLMPLPTRSMVPPRRQPDRAPSHRPTTIAIASPSADEQDGRPGRVEHDLVDRLAAVLDRVAEVARRRVGDVVDELVRDERLVEAPAGPVRRDDLGRQVRVLGHAVRRARHHPEQHEVEDHDREDRDHRAQELARDVAAAHASLPRASDEGRGATLVQHGVNAGSGYSSSPPPAAARRRESSTPPTMTTTTTTAQDDEQRGVRARAAGRVAVLPPAVALGAAVGAPALEPEPADGCRGGRRPGVADGCAEASVSSV